MGIINIAPRETPRDPSLQAYFKLISSYPLLTTDEEVELFEKMKSASTESEKLQYREQIINSNLRFVISVAKQYSSNKIPFLDLVQQ
jgi:RNA polymerase primary sigma factor